jgi:hypothetical protein
MINASDSGDTCFLALQKKLLTEGFTRIDQSKSRAAMRTPESTNDVTQFVEIQLVRANAEIAVFYGVTNTEVEYAAIDICNSFMRGQDHEDCVVPGSGEYKKARFCKLQAFDERRMPWLVDAVSQSAAECVDAISGFMERRFLSCVGAVKSREDHYSLLVSNPEFFPWGRTGGRLRFSQAAILGCKLGVTRDILTETLMGYDREVQMSFPRNISARNYMLFALAEAEKYRPN